MPRKDRRQKEILEALQERQAEEAMAQSARAQTDLFMIDTQGTTVPVTEKVTKGKKAKFNKGVTPLQEQQVKKMIKNGLNDSNKRDSSSQQDELVNVWDDSTTSTAVVVKKQKTNPPVIAGIKPMFHEKASSIKKISDIIKTANSNNINNKKTTAVDLAEAGQSYIPDPKAHEKTINKAAEVENRRLEAEHYGRTPLAQGMAPETRALLIGSDDSESEDEEAADDTVATTITKPNKKLTRAQRNKQKRVREIQELAKKKKAERQFLHQVNQAPRHLKQIEKEKEQKALAAKPAYAPRTLGKDTILVASQKTPLHVPTLPVALESSTSLRNIQVKGSLVVDRIYSLADRKLISEKHMNVTGKIKRKKRQHAKYKVKGAHEFKGPGFKVVNK